MYTSYLGDGINDISILIIPGNLVVAALLLAKKILFISGYSEDQISNKDLSTKKIDYLQKPFSGKELMTKVREVLDK